MRRQVVRTMMICSAWLCAASPCPAYLVGPALPLAQLERQSDLIVKASIEAIEPAADDWFKPILGYRCARARIKIISVLKGHAIAPTLQFDYYQEDPAYRGGQIYTPQHYNLKRGSSYLIFAAAENERGIFRQLWLNHTAKADQGVIRTLTPGPTDGSLALDRAIWKELTEFLSAPNPHDVVYGVQQLSEMAGCSPSPAMTPLHDFDAKAVYAAIAPLIRSHSPEIALAAISVFGATSPFLDESRASWWMASQPGSQIKGLSAIDLATPNRAASQYWNSLAAEADDPMATLPVRALAIRSLGQSRVRDLFPTIRRWLMELQPELRSASTLLLADYRTEPDATTLLAEQAMDTDPSVRAAAAYAIAGGRYVGKLNLLSTLLSDSADRVRDAASEATLSFPLQTVKPILAAHVTEPDHHVAFVLALGAQDAASYVGELSAIIRKDLTPPRFRGGQVPAYTAWGVLFVWLRNQSAEEFVSGRLNDCLDSMEHPKYFWSSSEARDLYALYMVKGANERATAFRKACQATIGYDMAPYFNEADRNPLTYVTSR